MSNKEQLAAMRNDGEKSMLLAPSKGVSSLTKAILILSSVQVTRISGTLLLQMIQISWKLSVNHSMEKMN